MARNRIDAYARAVVAGKVPAGKFHRLACARHLEDVKRQGSKGFPYQFDLARAERFFRFAERLRHYKGSWAGQLIVLSDCQQLRLGSLFGWVHTETGLRRFRKAYNELARKQGKSLEAAIVALYVTFFDGEAGAEGYVAATKREQAKIVFTNAKKLVQSSGLKSRIAVRVGNLHRADTDSKLEPLGADHDSTDGLNPNLLIIEEFHAHKTRGMIDVLETATGARDQPVIYEITTAGTDPLSPCGVEHDYACKILEGVLQNDRFFAFIAHADVAQTPDGKDDDPFKESTWRKANPHYGISVKPEDMRIEALEAKHRPSALAAFKQKRLNIWVNSATPWLNLSGWRKGQTVWSDAFRAALEARPCYAGLDLSSKTDLVAAVRLVPPTEADPKWYLLPYFLTPEEGLEDREHQARAPYQQWVDEGLLDTNSGPRIDHAHILRTIVAWPGQVERLGFDPWNIGNLATDLMSAWADDEGTRVIEVPQNMTQLSEPSKEFEALVLAGLIDAGGDPIMTWMVSNAVAIRDSNDNLRPTKDPKKSRGRIDGVSAAINALKLARLTGGDDDGDASKDLAERGLFL